MAFTIEHIKPQILTEYLDAFHIVSFSNRQDGRFVPQGTFEIIFPIEGQFQHKTAYNEQWHQWPISFIGGLHNQAYTIKSNDDKASYITVRFKTNTAKFFIPNRLNQFKNRLVNVNDLWGKSSVLLTQRILNTPCNVKRSKIIEQFLCKRFIQRKDSLIDHATEYIKNEKGMVNINELAKKIGYSNSHFRKCFNEEIGIAPSQFAKIERVNTAIKLLQNYKAKSLTELTYILGYFDQSHFIKDFKSVTNETPNFLRARITA